MITTAAKQIAPTPGSIVASVPRFTSATRIEIMKMSTIDQRPTCSMIRYIRLRSRSATSSAVAS